MKFWLYASTSLATCGALLWYTYLTRQQFYPSVIYLVTSKLSLLILGNAGLVLTLLLGRAVKSVFFTSLRDAEVELLHENVRFTITETCLALTIFREELTFSVMALFTSLVFLKAFHWIAHSRIEFIEQSDIIPRATHVRLVSLMTLLACIDMTFVLSCSNSVLESGPSVLLLFGFEFLIMFVTIITVFLRYVLLVIDLRMENAWTNKFTYLFYLDLISETVKLVVYLVFFLLIFSYYGLPLHLVRDLWLSVKGLQQRLASYYRYRQITQNLQQRFVSPTEEELEQSDRTCIICREEMEATSSKKLPCDHIFHIHCLKMWVQRQQTCPTCRTMIPTNPRPPTPPTAQPQPQPHAPYQAPPQGQAQGQPQAQPTVPLHPNTTHVPPLHDVESVRRQIEFVQAQLAAVQAAMPAHFQAGQNMFPMQFPTVPTTMNPTPTTQTPTGQTTMTPTPSPTRTPNTAESQDNNEELEEKEAPDESSDSVQETKEEKPEEKEIPRAKTEAEERREELRRRYTRIYGNLENRGEEKEES